MATRHLAWPPPTNWSRCNTSSMNCVLTVQPQPACPQAHCPRVVAFPIAHLPTALQRSCCRPRRLNTTRAPTHTASTLAGSALHDAVAAGCGRISPHDLLGGLLQNLFDLRLGLFDMLLRGALNEQEQLALACRVEVRSEVTCGGVQPLAGTRDSTLPVTTVAPPKPRLSAEALELCAEPGSNAPSGTGRPGCT